MSYKPFRGITPLFQSVLTREIEKFLDCIEIGNYDRAWTILKNIIDSLNPEDTEELSNNDVAHVDAQILKTQRQSSMDPYRSRVNAYQIKDEVLRRNLRIIYRKVVRVLHSKGYLEIKPLQPRSPARGDFSNE